MEKILRLILVVIIIGFSIISYQIHSQNKAIRQLDVKVEAISELLFRVV